ncbi:MAG: hypothetical protein O6943_11300, partial [Bacteroidetes bacterium]|nr:hypothetical protein [Bacteroidota bacterium]
MVKKLENPFKGLQPYRQEDAGTLFGRDRDLLLIQDRIFSTKTTLLFAGSGVGKTSFLNAKVIPETDQRYVICYHNQWSGDNPLHAVKIVLASGLAEKEPELKRDELLSFVENPEYRLKDFFNRYRSDRCIIILDQFEEIFQYHAYEPYFNQFLDELCEVINADDLQVRIVFSMREEFLGELSIFDNRIPDLFNNYYRLKYLDKSQAEGIIVRTCALVGVEPDTNKLQMLLNDLSKMEKEVNIFDEEAKQKSDSKPREIKLDFLIPPYLQIVCHETWDEQIKSKQDVKPENFIFLENYEVNGAQKKLGEFCHEKLSTLTTKEKNLTAKAFDFLVTKRGAKMAYDVESLATHMRTNINYLAQTLAKLSKPDTRILRESYRPDKSRWFELYHDMFSPIIYEWKETYQEKRRKVSRIRRAGIAVVGTAIVLILGAWILTLQKNIANYLQVQSTVNSLQQALDDVKQHVILVEDFRNQFRQARGDAPKSPEISKIK